MLLGQRHPALDAEYLVRPQPLLDGGAFRMDNALARRHPVEFAGRYLLLRSQAVAVIHFSVKKPGHRRKPDMRMGPHILSLPRLHGDGAKLVKENKRPHHLPMSRRQRAPNLKRTDIAHPWNDDDGQCIRGKGIAGLRIGSVGQRHDFPPMAARTSGATSLPISSIARSISLCGNEPRPICTRMRSLPKIL